MIMRLLNYFITPESETDCQKCNHSSSCSSGLPNCATYSPAPKRSTVMSFHPVMKRFSRPVIEQPTSPNIWEYTGIMLSGIMFIALTAAFEVAAK